jgi:hypothetical protein
VPRAGIEPTPRTDIGYRPVSQTCQTRREPLGHHVPLQRRKNNSAVETRVFFLVIRNIFLPHFLQFWEPRDSLLHTPCPWTPRRRKNLSTHLSSKTQCVVSENIGKKKPTQTCNYIGSESCWKIIHLTFYYFVAFDCEKKKHHFLGTNIHSFHFPW